MSPDPVIESLSADMAMAWHRFQTDDEFRRDFERDEFHQDAFDAAQRKGLIERVTPKAEVR